jgi:hypothetical protein
LATALGVAIWGGVFVFLLIALAVENDVLHRWDEQWVAAWESRTGRPVDDLLERLAHQISRWRMARRLAFLYLVLGVVALGVAAAIQFRVSYLSPEGFRTVLFVCGAILGLLLFPLAVSCEIGLNLVEGMRRQLRMTLGEKVVIHSRQELTGIPKPGKEKKKDKQAGK